MSLFCALFKYLQLEKCIVTEKVKSELEAKLLSYLEALESATKNTEGFLVEQMPLVAQEYIDWYFWSSLGIAVFCATVVCFAVIIGFWARMREIALEKAGCDVEQYVAMVIIAILTTVGFLVGLLTSLYHVLKVVVAPRLVLLEKIHYLLQTL